LNFNKTGANIKKISIKYWLKFVNYVKINECLDIVRTRKDNYTL